MQLRNTKNALILFGCLAIISGSSFGQTNAKFQYRGHPVHPLLLNELLPDPETNTSIGCIDLDYNTEYDTIKAINSSSKINGGTWYLSYFSDTGYTDYHFVSAYKNYSCVLVRDVDGSLSQAFVCFFFFNNNEICLKGFLNIQNIRDEQITISGDNLMVGSACYTIDSIIHTTNN